MGDWSVKRVYEPGTDRERTVNGTLKCSKALSERFIKCTYFFERKGRAPIHDDVFLNFNAVYGVYESVWLSATWPIQVIMSAKPSKSPGRLVWDSNFLIENNVREWVRSTWTIDNDGGTFARKTDIRTSRHPDANWTHWMNESANRTP